MTDRQGALAALLGARDRALADAALERFHAMFEDEALVVDKWFALQATAPEHDGKVFERVKRLLRHPDFSLANPNRARSLIGAFCLANPAGFHRADGAGYAFWADRVLELDAHQPAARVADRARARPLEPARRAVSQRRRAPRSPASPRRPNCRATRARSSRARWRPPEADAMATRSKGRKNAFYAQSGGVTAVINASACGVIETARAHRDVHRQRLRRAQRHHRRAHRGPDRHRQGIGGGDPRRCARRPSGAFGSCRYKLKSLDKNRREYERLIEVFRAHDIAWFFYNGGGDSADTCFKVSQLSRVDGLSAAGDPRAEDGRQRPADHRLLPGLRLGRQVRRRVGARSVVRRALDGAHLDQGVRARGDGPPRRLDRRGRRADRGARHPGRDPLPRDRVRRDEVHRPRRRAGQGARLLHGRRLRRLRTTPTARFLAEQGTRDAFGHAQLGGAAPVVANMVKQRARPQVPLGRRRLPAARGAPHRLEDRRAPGLRARQARGRAGAEGRTTR